MKKQTDIAIDQYKFFKDQMMLLIITDDFKKDDIKKENGEVDDVDHDYIGDEYKDLQRWINDYFKFTLSDRDLHLTEFYSRKFTLINIANNYLEKNILMWMIYCLVSRNPLKIYQMLTVEYI